MADDLLSGLQSGFGLFKKETSKRETEDSEHEDAPREKPSSEPKISIFPKFKEELKREIKEELREELKRELRAELDDVRRALRSSRHDEV